MAVYWQEPISEIQGSTFLEVITSISVVPLSSWLLTCILASFPAIASTTGQLRLVIESLILFGPFIILVTTVGNYSILSIIYPCVLLGLSLYILTSKRTAYMSPRWTEFLLIPKATKFTQVKDVILLKAYFNLLATTCICILAVDFQWFPLHFTKNDVYGFSLMDIGIGAFVAINAMISPEARLKSLPSHQNAFQLAKSLSISNLPLFIIGFLRAAFVTITGYPQNAIEYGVHWNSFFTLAMVRMIGSLIHHYVKGRKAILLATLIALGHQVCLSSGLSKFIQEGERSNIIFANKEGVFSLPGFIAIYIYSLELGIRWYRKYSLSNKSIAHVGRLMEASIISVATLSMTLIVDLLIEPVSRREANLSYISWTIFVLTYTLGLESMMQLVIEFSVGLGLLDEQKYSNSSMLLNCFMCKAFVVFMIANIFTGLINMLNAPAKSSIGSCIIILYCYMLSITLIGEQLLNRAVRGSKLLSPSSWVSRARSNKCK